VRTLIFLAVPTIPLDAVVTKLPVVVPTNKTKTSSVRAWELAAGTIILLAGIAITKQQPLLTDNTAWWHWSIESSWLWLWIGGIDWLWGAGGTGGQAEIEGSGYGIVVIESSELAEVLLLKEMLNFTTPMK
jgi:hypothetical protein